MNEFKQEIDGIVAAMRADIAREILSNRSREPNDGRVASFVKNVMQHRGRVEMKLRNVAARSSASNGEITDALDAVSNLAKTAIDRVTAAGRVEFAEVV